MKKKVKCFLQQFTDLVFKIIFFIYSNLQEAYKILDDFD